MVGRCDLVVSGIILLAQRPVSYFDSWKGLTSERYLGGREPVVLRIRTAVAGSVCRGRFACHSCGEVRGGCPERVKKQPLVGVLGMQRLRGERGGERHRQLSHG